MTFGDPLVGNRHDWRPYCSGDELSWVGEHGEIVGPTLRIGEYKCGAVYSATGAARALHIIGYSRGHVAENDGLQFPDINS
ncbi:hypothetical protein ASC66_06805 [Leifsonia sp. Root4]|nr:hypothetical protein ASC66_06805 [Leifsonia sp. Root4]